MSDDGGGYDDGGYDDGGYDDGGYDDNGGCSSVSVEYEDDGGENTVEYEDEYGGDAVYVNDRGDVEIIEDRGYDNELIIDGGYYDGYNSYYDSGFYYSPGYVHGFDIYPDPVIYVESNGAVRGNLGGVGRGKNKKSKTWPSYPLNVNCKTCGTTGLTM